MNKQAKPDIGDIKGVDWRGIGLVIAGAFCFSLAIPFIRWTDDLPTVAIAFYRALFGLLFMTTLLPRDPRPLHVSAYRPAISRLLLLGLLMGATVTLYTYAIQRTTAAAAALLVNSAPIYVAVLSPLVLHESRARYTWISLLVAVIGIVCISNPAELKIGSNLWGLAAATLSGFTYAFVLLIGRGLRGQVSSVTQTMWGLALVALLLMPWALQAPADTVWRNLHVLVPLGVFSLGMSYWLYFLGLARISAQVVSVVALFEPVSGVIIGLLFFAEVPNPVGWIGAVLILASMVLIAR